MISPYLVHLTIMIGIYAIVTVSMNLSVGFTGLLNLGHIAFFGIGAYASALLSLHGLPVWFSAVIACIIAMVFGFLLAIPTSRIRGDYLALVTLGFTFIAASVSRNWTGLTRGALGLPGIPGMWDKQAYALLVLGVLFVTVIVLWLLLRSRTGKILQAIRDDETAAKVLGKNTFAHKLLAMGLSALFAGLAGALYAHYVTFVDPTIFSIPELVLLVSMLIIGGLASLPGSILGTALLFAIYEPLRFVGFPPEVVGPLREIIYSIILLMIIVFRPKGLLGKVDLE